MDVIVVIVPVVLIFLVSFGPDPLLAVVRFGDPLIGIILVIFIVFKPAVGVGVLIPPIVFALDHRLYFYTELGVELDPPFVSPELRGLGAHE